LSNLIKILPQHIANRIAAGEVVGRPEAVVKELIENSIDAGAKNIQVIIREAGKALIQVIDDGFGMSEDDAVMSMQRHATSKIKNAEDLESISTFGFRGEALASICAVAQVEMKTKRNEDELGVVIKNSGSEIEEVSKTQCPNGTSITVKNLFYNTPARRNFLKSDQTEFKHIYETFVRLALANPQISFEFINLDEVIFELPATELAGRIRQIYGENYFGEMIEVSEDTGLISVSGFIAKPSFTRKTKQDQLLFLNGRYIINRSLSFAVHHAYEDLVEKGDYPNFFLFINLDPKKFDINVHPSKLEVKFDDERAIFSFVRRSIKNSLEKNDLVFASKLETVGIEQQRNYSPPHSRGYVFQQTVSQSEQTEKFEFKKHSASQFNIHEMIPEQRKDFNKDNLEKLFKAESAEEISSVQKPKNIDRLDSKNGIWQFNLKYIMYQLESSLMIIDQHAAHERILYEQTLTRLNANANLSQQLLIPLMIELNTVDHEIAKSIEQELKSLGFDIEFMAKRKIRVRGVPSDVKVGSERVILQELIDQFKEYDIQLNLEKRDNLAKSYACKHAIKANDYLAEDEMLNLIDKLFACEMPYVCPHGRPTIIKISIDELDKKFARTGF